MDPATAGSGRDRRSWFNRRGAPDVFALTASDAYEWHRRCPCQGPRPDAWCQVSGRGDEGRWSASWLDWLARTHLAPRGFEPAGAPAARMLEFSLAVGPESVERLRSAVTGGNPTAEPAPVPPPTITRRDRHR